MTRGLLKAVMAGAVVALALVIAGCGDSKKGEPKVNNDAPKIQPKAAGGPGAPKGASD